MTRLHADPVEVSTRAAAAGPVPDEFLWHGRRYVVREVLARWTESGSWWTGVAIRALTTGSGSTSGPLAPRIDDCESHWWRVEADAGRLAAISGGAGVYDLCFEVATSRWSLKRVMD
jgi:hypothetical protein